MTFLCGKNQQQQKKRKNYFDHKQKKQNCKAAVHVKDLSGSHTIIYGIYL